MGTRQNMPPHGDKLREEADKAIKKIDYKKELSKKARAKYDVNSDPPYRPEEERN